MRYSRLPVFFLENEPPRLAGGVFKSERLNQPLHQSHPQKRARRADLSSSSSSAAMSTPTLRTQHRLWNQTGTPAGAQQQKITNVYVESLKAWTPGSEAYLKSKYMFDILHLNLIMNFDRPTGLIPTGTCCSMPRTTPSCLQSSASMTRARYCMVSLPLTVITGFSNLTTICVMLEAWT
jgi:hypothetical protein